MEENFNSGDIGGGVPRLRLYDKTEVTTAGITKGSDVGTESKSQPREFQFSLPTLIFWLVLSLAGLAAIGGGLLMLFSIIPTFFTGLGLLLVIGGGFAAAASVSAGLGKFFEWLGQEEVKKPNPIPKKMEIDNSAGDVYRSALSKEEIIENIKAFFRSISKSVGIFLQNWKFLIALFFLAGITVGVFMTAGLIVNASGLGLLLIIGGGTAFCMISSKWISDFLDWVLIKRNAALVSLIQEVVVERTQRKKNPLSQELVNALYQLNTLRTAFPLSSYIFISGLGITTFGVLMGIGILGLGMSGLAAMIVGSLVAGIGVLAGGVAVLVFVRGTYAFFRAKGRQCFRWADNTGPREDEVVSDDDSSSENESQGEVNSDEIPFSNEPDPENLYVEFLEDCDRYLPPNGAIMESDFADVKRLLSDNRGAELYDKNKALQEKYKQLLAAAKVFENMLARRCLDALNDDLLTEVPLVFSLFFDNPLPLQNWKKSDILDLHNKVDGLAELLTAALTKAKNNQTSSYDLRHGLSNEEKFSIEFFQEYRKEYIKAGKSFVVENPDIFEQLQEPDTSSSPGLFDD